MKALGYIVFGLLVVVLPLAVALGWPFMQDSPELVEVRAVRQLPVEDRAWTPTVPRPSTTVPPTTTTYPKPTVRLIPPAPAAPASQGVERHLQQIKNCESGGDYGAVSSTGKYRGAYQFDQETWESVGGSGDPAAAPPAEQDARARELYRRSGSAPWPHCGRGAA